jgi:hypothetical protein
MGCCPWEIQGNDGGAPRRFYPNQHPFYCGIAVHARSLDVCLVSHDGAVLVPRTICKPLQSRSGRLLPPIAPLWSWPSRVAFPGLGWRIAVPAKACPSSWAMPSPGKRCMVARPQTTRAMRTRWRPASGEGGGRRPLSLRWRGGPPVPAGGGACLSGGNARSAGRLSTRPRAHSTSRSSARKARTKPSATASPRASPSPRSPRASRSRWPSVTPRTSAAQTWHGLAGTRPSPLRLLPCTVCARAQAGATSWPSSCATHSTLSSASPASRMWCRMAAWSRVPRHPRANATERPARKSVPPPGRGPVPKRPSCCCATMKQVKRIWPAWKRNMAQARPCLFSRRNWRGPCPTGGNAQGPLPWPPACTGNGGAGVSSARLPGRRGDEPGTSALSRRMLCVCERGVASRPPIPEPDALLGPALPLWNRR